MNIKSTLNYDNHKALTFVYDKKTELFGAIAIHRGNDKIPSFGATRVWPYKSEKKLMDDVVSLSRLMSYKAALAGLKCGGAKAALFMPRRMNQYFFMAYARKVNLLGGSFVTGADVGLTVENVRLMKTVSPYFVGTKANPVYYTALGIFHAIGEAARAVFGSTSIKGKSFAVQGVGKVGTELLSYLYPCASKIFASDINPNAIQNAQKLYPNIKVVEPGEILRQKVDFLSPNALGGVINQESLDRIRAKAIVGGANCQLKNEKIAQELYNRGILYVPDYVANAGGLISVFDEHEYKVGNKRRLIRRLGVIRKNIKLILSESTKTKTPPVFVADKMAQQIFNSYD